jgi:hypothetical protein
MSTGRRAKTAHRLRVNARGYALGVGTPAPKPQPVRKPRKIPSLWRLLYENPYGGDRLKLPTGETVRLPDRTHPGCAAVRRILAGNEEPGDQELRAAWIATMDPRYVAYMNLLDRTPQQTEDMISGPSHRIGDDAAGARTVIARFASAVNDGTMEMCPHVRQQAPQPAYWMGWAPGKLRCRDCSMTEYRRIKGTTADFTCDACGHITRNGIQSVSRLTPPVLYRQVLVRVFIAFGLCPRCLGDPAAAPKPRLKTTEGD